MISSIYLASLYAEMFFFFHEVLMPKESRQLVFSIKKESKLRAQFTKNNQKDNRLATRVINQFECI